MLKLAMKFMKPLYLNIPAITIHTKNKKNFTKEKKKGSKKFSSHSKERKQCQQHQKPQK